MNIETSIFCRTSLNRTIIGLKETISSRAAFSSTRLNRTIIGLKADKSKEYEAELRSLNRTIIGLKVEMVYYHSMACIQFESNYYRIERGFSAYLAIYSKKDWN